MKENNNLLTFIENEKKMLESSASFNKLAKTTGHIDGEIIGTGRSDYTCSATDYNLNIKGKEFLLIDIPGIEGNESKYKSIIKKSLEKSHIIFFVNGSGKKIEKGTLEKIKGYMKDGTSVYTVFNVHCKPKKNRVAGIDNSYSEDLKEAYCKQEEIVIQTERSLKSFLGDNYKGSISVNGLLAFCSEAFQDQNIKISSIVIDEGKSLIDDQRKYAKEYSGDISAMMSDSHIFLLTNTIEHYILNFEKTIYDENIKKLKSRLYSTLDSLDHLRRIEFKKYNEWKDNNNDLKNRCSDARYDFIDTIDQIGAKVVKSIFIEVETDLLDLVDKGECSLKNVDIITKNYFEEHNKTLENELKRNIEKEIISVDNRFKEDISDSIQRTNEDNCDIQKRFVESINGWRLDFNGNISTKNKINFKEIGKHFKTIGEFAFGGFSLGTAVPGIGNFLGTIVGTVIGIAMSIWNFFATKKGKANIVKKLIFNYIDRIIEETTDKINDIIKSMNFEEYANSTSDRISEQVRIQNESIDNIKATINKAIFEINKEKNSIL